MIRKILTMICVSAFALNTLLWIASYWNIWIFIGRTTHGTDIGLARGCLFVHYLVYSGGGPRPVIDSCDAGGFNGLQTVWAPPMVYGGNLPGSTEIDAYVPVNLFAVVLMPITIYLLLPIHRRRKRKKLGLCTKCAYDLRGSKDICPECGQEFETT